MKTLAPIEYSESRLRFSTTIPAGTPVRRAQNMPRECYFAEPWAGMTKREKLFLSIYGYILLPCEVGADLPGLDGA